VKFRSRLFTALNLLLSMASHHPFREQLQLSTQRHEAAADVAYASAVVTSEVRDGLEVRRQATGQPHHLDVALRLALQPPARLDAVHVAVDVDLEQDCGVVRRPAGAGRVGAGEAEVLQV
jgi:hypothetical protein